MNMNKFGHVSIVFEYDMMCAHVYRVKCFNFSNIRIRTDFYIRRMQILINSVTSLNVIICSVLPAMMVLLNESNARSLFLFSVAVTLIHYFNNRITLPSLSGCINIVMLFVVYQEPSSRYRSRHSHEVLLTQHYLIVY